VPLVSALKQDHVLEAVASNPFPYPPHQVPLISALKQDLLETADPHERLMKSALYLKKIVKEYSRNEGDDDDDE
jgi:hypothetical protein